MKYSPIFSDEANVGRRRFIGYAVTTALVLLPLAACAGGQGKQTSMADKKPFWEREAQSPVRQSGRE